MVQTLSETVILPIAGVILAFVMTLELIQLIADRNNLHDVDTWMFFRWVFKTACAILIVTNTWNTMPNVLLNFCYKEPDLASEKITRRGRYCLKF